MTYDLKLDKELIKLKFKKKWFDDKSGYWFEKKVKYKDFKLGFTVQTDNKLFIMECQTYEYSSRVLNKRQAEDIAMFKPDIKTIKKVLRRYK